MVREGALEGVDEIYGIHLNNYHEHGYVGVKHGPIMASSGRLASCRGPVDVHVPRHSWASVSRVVHSCALVLSPWHRFTIDIVGKGAALGRCSCSVPR